MGQDDRKEMDNPDVEIQLNAWTETCELKRRQMADDESHLDLAALDTMGVVVVEDETVHAPRPPVCTEALVDVTGAAVAEPG